MTDTEKLNHYIQETGLKKNHIAKILGIRPATLARKIANAQDFTGTEIKALCKLLGITDLEVKESIFFAGEVA